MTLLATLKQMVEALETYGDKHRKTYLLEGAWDEEITKGDAAIQAGKQAIKELESQEPLAWIDADGNVSDNNDHKCFPIPLYTHPLQRTWVGLTDEEKNDCLVSADPCETLAEPEARQLIEDVEQALKGKNT